MDPHKKVFLFIFLSAVLVENSIQTEIVDATNYGLLEDMAKGALECVRKILNNGIPELNIDNFNPWKLGTHELKFDEDYLRGFLHLDNVKLHGLPDFNVSHLKAHWNTLHFIVSNNILFEANYDADMRAVDLIDLVGKGNIRMSAYLQLGGSVTIPSFNLSIKEAIIKPKVAVTGILNNDKMNTIINKQIQLIIDDFLNQYAEDIKSTLETIIQNLLKNTTANAEISAILEIIVKTCSK